ncbi:Uncharacterised protein [Mycobacteroides abscessus subsp. bolletii]|nr:Uncharacterised protein [Mycobacteroides abscessus subsp. bolletii]SHR68413.1 Uncharacterised protein [Mycobacteroides abscessus subsp. bolletii]SHS15431.1 Uncharacterised protein [Mycobacteroides abscessus subsp. bolletii]SKF76237.1 Uncharacterised protein [Mycobacteroides abscessus subsp. bolletii]SKF79169.1 Uncharacterised protein [Mycobacteroides abscessus subsp. bolletii]
MPRLDKTDTPPASSGSPLSDPRQLQPIVTMPPAAEETLARAFGISETWTPSRTSVQGVSDRSGLWGTYIGDNETDRLWIGAPLLVHRRCDQPMFSICNHIAYGGIMIQANTCDWTHLLGSSWIDVPNPRRGPRVQDNEITALVSTRAIAQGSQRGVVCPFAVTVLPGVGAWGGLVVHAGGYVSMHTCQRGVRRRPWLGPFLWRARAVTGAAGSRSSRRT